MNSLTWGVFQADGLQEVAVADSVVSLDYRSDSRQSNYPQEKGAFASYNKVQMPYQARVRLTKGGANEERRDFLAKLQRAKDTTQIVSISTPDASYVSASIVGLDYRRERVQGAYLLIVDLHIEEVRVTGVAAYSSTKTPSGARSVSGGTVQASPTTPQQQQAVSGAR